jgi:predicted nucleic acid-binding protein
MREAVLADTGPLYAAVDPHDLHHRRALQELEQLARSRREVMVSFSTLLETHSLVMRRLGRQIAQKWLAEMSAAALVNPNPDDYRQAAARLRTFADQPITLFDATVAALALRMGVQVWTYDHHFDMMHVSIWR